MRREPEVPDARVSVVECLDGPARITSKELAPIHSVKNGILQNACSTSPRVVADLWKSALMRIARLTDSQAKHPKKGDKSVVAMLKKHEQHDRTVRPVHTSNARQLGCVFQDMEPTNPLYVTLTFETKILRSESFDQVNLISVAPTLQNLRIGLRRRQSGKSKVPVKQRGG